MEGQHASSESIDMPVLIPSSRVLRLCNPLQKSPWDAEQVTQKLVKTALANRWWSPAPVGHNATAELHATRIAFLVEHGWSDHIDIDVGVPSMRCYVYWPVLDGNHRLAAASIRGDREILAMVGGCLDHAKKLFGVECEEIQH